MHKNHIAFISHVKKECRKYGVKLLLSKKDEIKLHSHGVGGYFDVDRLVVSNGSEKWVISTLVHEFSHMEQWIESDPTFTHKLRGGFESTLIMDNWIDGSIYKKTTINKAISLSRDCELNCERRSIENIKKFNLNLDIDTYCQEANAYIMSYNFVRSVRTWNFKNSIYDLRIVNEMPSDMSTLNYNRLSHKYKKLFMEVLM